MLYGRFLPALFSKELKVIDIELWREALPLEICAISQIAQRPLQFANDTNCKTLVQSGKLASYYLQIQV